MQNMVLAQPEATDHNCHDDQFIVSTHGHRVFSKFVLYVNGVLCLLYTIVCLTFHNFHVLLTVDIDK